jgi:hypothetical protein
MKPRTFVCLFALVFGVTPAAIARVGSSYDGAWNLLFVTHAELANIRVMNARIEGGKPTDKMPIGT